MAGTRQILQRRKAVSNICRITRTMQMVSTAMYKSYYNKWLAVVDYHDALAQAGYLLLSSRVPIENPLLKENSSGRSAVLAIGSKRGLCGSYNNAVYRLLDVHIKRTKSLGKKLDIYAPTGKIVNVLNYHGIPPAKVYDDIGEMPTDSQIHDMADEFMGQYMAGELDYFGIVYMRFYSMSSQQAQTLTVMPLTELIDDLTTRAKAIWPWDLSFEDFYLSPSPAEIIEGLGRMIIHSSIKSCFMDAILSEHVARMVAMRNATENADEMIKELTAEYNRARQTQITGELLDIISGTGDL